MRETGFTDRQLEQIAQIIAKTVPPLIEAALAPINKRLDRLENNVELIMSLPTIKKRNWRS